MPALQFVRETYGTEEELQEQAVEWLEQQDLRDFQREYEAELAEAAVQFGEAEVRASGARLCWQQHGRQLWLGQIFRKHLSIMSSSSSMWITPRSLLPHWRAVKRFIVVSNRHSCWQESVRLATLQLALET